VAEQAMREGLADELEKENLSALVESKMWEPVYSTYRRRRSR
jgi:hypothetical protein